MPIRFSALCALALMLAACANVSTHVVQLDPSRTFSPTQNVEVLLEKPKRPHTEIGLLESRGGIGVTEAELLNDAREKARALGADAIVRVESEQQYQPPVAIYDPWYDPFYWSYRYHRAYPPPFVQPWAAYRLVGGGYTTTLKTRAIKYQQ
jgi:hypothetical protein